MAANSMIGLKIGSSTIGMVEMRASGGKYEVTSLGIMPTPEGAVVGGSVVDPTAVGAVVKELLLRCGAKTKQCVSSVSGQTSLVVRVIEVPRMSQKELDDMMKFELERHIPFQPDEVVKDYKVITRPGEDPASPNMEVLLAAAQDEMINTHSQALEAAGLNPRAIDVEPLAASRVIVDLMGGPGETVGLLNIGGSSSEISIVRDGLLAFTRTVPIGGDALTQAIQEMFDVTRPDAERIKKEAGTALPPEAPAASGGFAAGPVTQPGRGAQPATIPGAPVSDALDFDLTGVGDEPAQGAQAGPKTFNFDLDVEPVRSGPASTAPAQSSSSALSFDLSLDEPAAKPAAPAAGLDLDLDISATPPAEATSHIPSVEAGPVELAPVVSHGPAGHDGAQSIDVYNAIVPVLVELTGEIRRSLEYFTGKYPDIPIARMVIFGGGARLRNMDVFLQNELGLRTAIANPFAHLNVVASGVSQEYLHDLGPAITVAVGLALRDMITK